MSKNKQIKTAQTSHKTRAVLLKITPIRLVSLFLSALGLIALVFSIIYTSSILAFIGLGLTFWGALTLYITTEEYVKQTLLDHTITPSLVALNQILTELKYQGKPIYLPPKYLKDFETTKIYIPKNKNTNLPTPEEIQQQENKTFLKNPEAALIIPPGLSLSKLFEKTLGTTFTKVDLEYLQQNLPRLFIENLEIAENLEIRTEDDITKSTTIHAKITKPFYTDTFKEAEEPSQLTGSIGDPICSAIAIAITKATGKPVRITDTKSSEDGNTIEASYEIIEE